MIVTSTLLVSYGGLPAENYFFETENPYHDPKMQYFMPMKNYQVRHVVQMNGSRLKNIFSPGMQKQ